MKSCRWWAFVALLAVGGAASTRAQMPYSTLTKLYDATDGTTFRNLVLAGDGKLYGIAVGTTSTPFSIFQLTPAGVFTTLHQFTGTDGTTLTSLFVARNGKLYGTTNDGGSAMFGTVFRLTPAGVFTTLYEFTTAPDARPTGLFQASDGDLYGYTSGYYDYKTATVPYGGTLFRLALDGQYTVLHRFGPNNDASSFIQTREGDFFGSAVQDRLAGVFQLLPDGTTSTINESPTKRLVLSNLLQSTDGNFYGLYLYFGKDDNDPPENALVRFTPDGQRTAYFLNPGYGTVDHMIQGQDGKFYITAVEEIFEDIDGGTVECAVAQGNSNALYAFPPPVPNGDPDYPTSGVIEASDGRFYGAATGDFDSYIYRLTASFPAVTLAAVVPEVIAGSGGNGKAQVTLSGPWPFDLNVYYKVKGDAVPEDDFKARLGGVLTIPAGQTSAFIKIRPGTHQGHDGTKTVKLKLEPGGVYTMGASRVAKIVIRAQ